MDTLEKIFQKTGQNYNFQELGLKYQGLGNKDIYSGAAEQNQKIYDSYVNQIANDQTAVNFYKNLQSDLGLSLRAGDYSGIGSYSRADNPITAGTYKYNEAGQLVDASGTPITTEFGSKTPFGNQAQAQANSSSNTTTVQQPQNTNQQEQPTNQQQQNQPQPNIPAPALQLTQNLQQGSQGAEVAQLQQVLGGLDVDGKFGPKTLAAVKAFQASHGLVADGIVGPKTLAAINASKVGPSPAKTVATGVMERKNTTEPTAPKIPSTGNSTVDSLIKVLNNQSPQKSFTDVYKEIYTSLGLDTMKEAYKAQTEAYSKLQNEKNDAIQEINNNPWYSEGIRVKELEKLDKKYEGKENILTNKLKLLETNISNGRSDAQFVAGQMMDQLQQSHKLDQDIIFKAIDIAEKQAEAERALAKPIEVSGGSTLYDQKGNKIVTAPKIATPGSSATFTKQQISAVGKEIEKSKGSDGYVDPNVYQQAYTAWVQAGGLAKDFIAQFPPKNYVNPQNKTLPEYLRNPKSKTRAL